jgi:hypothetical protein
VHCTFADHHAMACGSMPWAKRKGCVCFSLIGLMVAKEIGPCIVKVLGPSSMIAEWAWAWPNPLKILLLPD